ncbi:hypothetical protein LguiA_009409 [Lonicera macranthoides]
MGLFSWQKNLYRGGRPARERERDRDYDRDYDQDYDRDRYHPRRRTPPAVEAAAVHEQKAEEMRGLRTEKLEELGTVADVANELKSLQRKLKKEGI